MEAVTPKDHRGRVEHQLACVGAALLAGHPSPPDRCRSLHSSHSSGPQISISNVLTGQPKSDTYCIRMEHAPTVRDGDAPMNTHGDLTDPAPRALSPMSLLARFVLAHPRKIAAFWL